jgi:hypothetical protein
MSWKVSGKNECMTFILFFLTGLKLSYLCHIRE